jgi:hypothetical protein
LAKPMKRSNKFVVKSSGLSIAEKATTVIVKIASKKTYSAPTDGSSVIRTMMHALDYFGSSSSVSDDETTPPPPGRPHKRPRKFPLPKGVPKPSVMRGNFE